MVTRPGLRRVGRAPSLGGAAPRPSVLVAIASCAVALTAGCSFIYLDAPELPRDERAVDRSSVAVLVGSVTQSDPLLPARNSYSDVTFSFDSPAGGGRFRLKNAQLGLRHMAAPDADEGLEEVHGRLFAVPVAPGAYELRKVSMWFQATVEAVLAEPLRVTVSAGEVVYIGNLAVENCYSAHVGPDGRRVRSTVVGGFPSVNDESVRDLRLLRAVYPALREAVIDVRVLPGPALVAQARDPLSRHCTFERGGPD